MNLSTLKPPAGQKRARRRVGRGMGSGHGKTAGRGHKGRGARSGVAISMAGFKPWSQRAYPNARPTTVSAAPARDD